MYYIFENGHDMCVRDISVNVALKEHCKITTHVKHVLDSNKPATVVLIVTDPLHNSYSTALTRIS